MLCWSHHVLSDKPLWRHSVIRFIHSAFDLPGCLERIWNSFVVVNDYFTYGTRIASGVKYYLLPLWEENLQLSIHPIFNRLRLFKQSDVSGQPEFWKYWMKTEKISPRAQRNSEETGQGDSQSHQVEFQKVMTYKQYMWLQIKR